MAKSILQKNKLASRGFISQSTATDHAVKEETSRNFGWAQGVALATSLFALRRMPVKALATVLGTGVLIGIGIATYKRQKQEPY